MMYALTKRYSLVLLCALSILLISSCDSNKISHAISIEGMATAEGPFFEGSNTFQANLKLTAAPSWDQTWQLEAIKSGRAVVLELNATNDAANFDAFNSASIQLIANDLAMISLGAINPIEPGSNKLTVTLSDEVDITPYLKADNFTVIVDIDFKQDLEEESLSIPFVLNFSLAL